MTSPIVAFDFSPTSDAPTYRSFGPSEIAVEPPAVEVSAPPSLTSAKLRLVPSRAETMYSVPVVTAIDALESLPVWNVRFPLDPFCSRLQSLSRLPRCARLPQSPGVPHFI